MKYIIKCFEDFVSENSLYESDKKRISKDFKDFFYDNSLKDGYVIFENGKLIRMVVTSINTRKVKKDNIAYNYFSKARNKNGYPSQSIKTEGNSLYLYLHSSVNDNYFNNGSFKREMIEFLYENYKDKFHIVDEDLNIIEL
jgi:hypothetical protein